MIKRKIFSLLLLFTVSINSVSVLASPLVVGYKSINNSSNGSYKTDVKDLEESAESIGEPSDVKEYINYNKDKQYISSNPEISYLIDNDILGDDLNITYDRRNITTESSPKFDFTSESVIRKSDFLITLSKSIFGLEESRGVIFHTPASRNIDGKQEDLYVSSSYIPKGYEGEELTFDFSKGDYSVFVTPNVYENYFKTMIDKGMISINEFSNIKFVEDFNNYGLIVDGVKSFPSWSNNLGFYNVLKGNGNNGYRVDGTIPLGQSFSYKEEDPNVHISNSKVDWFFDEDLLTISALEYIEKFLRISEKDMTDSEAEIINYKYGASYLSRLDDSTKRTVMFLVAKGILNFENEEEFEDLYKPLDGKMFTTLMYRVHNKDARLDFSKIQLTDSDNYWLSQGYYKNQFNFIRGTAPITETSIKQEEQVSRNSFIKSREITITDSDTIGWDVSRKYYPGVQYYYKDVLLEEGAKHDDIKSAKLIGTTLDVVFKIKAPSPTAAIGMLDANTKSKVNGNVEIGSIPALSNVTTDGKSYESYISQSVFKKLKGFPIKVIEDKYLVNTETGARALLLEDNDTAIVGNEIIKTSKNIVSGVNNEVYYNLDVISKLLTDAMISEIDPNSIYISSTSDGKLPKENIYAMKSSNGSKIGDVYVRRFESSSILTNPNAPNTTSPKSFYNVTHSNSGNNFLIREFTEDVNSSTDRRDYMVVEFKYVIPDSASDFSEEFLNNFNSGTLSLQDTYSTLYTRPSESKTLSKWWDSNIKFNDALLNYMMGTVGEKYFVSGYITPSISILSDGSGDDVIEFKDVNNFLVESLGLTSNVIGPFANNSDGVSFIQSYFSTDSHPYLTGDTAYDSLRSRRTFEILPMITNVNKTTNYKDFSKFVITPSGHVYRNLDNNNEFDYSEKNKTILSYTRSRKVPVFSKGVQYTSPGRDDFNKFLGVSSGNVVKIASLKAHEGDIKGGSISVSGKSLTDYVTSLRDEVFPKSKSVNYSLVDCTANLGNFYTQEKGFYFYLGNFYERVSPKEIKMISHKDKKLEGKKVKFYPNALISTTDYSPGQNGLITDKSYLPSLDMSNIINVSLTSQIIDSIVYNSSDFVNTKDIPDNARVVIGDLEFIKSGNALVSTVLSDPSISTEYSYVDLLGEGGKSSRQQMISKIIGNQQITLVNKGMISGGESLANYLDSNITDIGRNATNGDLSSTLVKDNMGNLRVVSGADSIKYTPGTNFSSYVIAISFDSAIKFRPIGKDNSLYTLVSTVNKGSDGFLDNFDYFSESLSFSDMEGLNINLNKTKYEESMYDNELIEKFKDLFSIKRERDVLGIVKYWIRIIMSILCISNIMVFYLKRSMIDVVAQDIRYRGNDKLGPDLYKILTFGFQDVDTDTELWKAIGVSFLFFLIASIVSL